MATNILLLCAGNLCRSPMAEGLLRECLPAHELFSAGLCAQEGVPADPIAVRLMHELGIDISAHRARRLSTWMLHEADLVLTMDRAQQRYVQSRYPSAARKVQRIGEPDRIDIPDPYQCGDAAFRLSLGLIRQAVRSRFAQIQPAFEMALH